MRASGEERHGLEEIDLLLGDPVLSDVITSAQFELLGNVRGSVPPNRTPGLPSGRGPDARARRSCATAIQGTMEEVSVRIGIHFAEVSRDAGGLSGRGVHEAARISALGAGGEVIASMSTLARATGKVLTHAVRKVEVKGLPGEMEVATVQLGGSHFRVVPSASAGSPT